MESAFAKITENGELPRKVVYNNKVGKYEGIVLVQDASVIDPKIPNKLADELFLDDLENIVLDSNSKYIYICCINRGILAEALNKADSGPYIELTETFINQISLSISSSHDACNAWPLENFSDVAFGLGCRKSRRFRLI